uniref:Aminopeptidase N-like N-terminal domain-containing protein n=1 Tax=Acrobeloides nanus TaxID=290746 RepID=A0A914C594_9BILA
MGTFKKLLVVLLLLVQIFVAHGYYPRKPGHRRASFRKNYLDKVLPQNSLPKKFASKSWLEQQDEITIKRNEFTNESVLIDRLEEEHFINLATIPRLPKNIQIEQYWITVQPYFPAPNVSYPPNRIQTFDGYTKIRFNMTQDAMSIVVDALRLNFTNVKLLLNGTRQPLISTSYDNTSFRLTITPVLFLKAGNTYELEFNYTGLINGYTTGGLFFSYWLNAQWTRPANGYIIATFFEIGSGARSVFPCFDDPSFKARFTVTLIYPSSYQALSNRNPSSPPVPYAYVSCILKVCEILS